MAIVLIRAVRTKKNANYGVQLFLKRPFRLGCFVLVFFQKFMMFSSSVIFSYVLKGKSLLLFHKSWNSVLSYHLLLFIGLLFHSILFFSPFFALLPPFLLFQKLWQSVFVFFSSAFVLVFPCVSNAARRLDLVRDEALRLCLSPPPPPKKCCLTEDDQLGFLGNCLPTPPLSHR